MPALPSNECVAPLVQVNRSLRGSDQSFGSFGLSVQKLNVLGFTFSSHQVMCAAV